MSIQEEKIIKIEPNCRYGHGKLAGISDYVDGDFALISSPVGPTSVRELDFSRYFAGRVYVCLTCGYTELFDSELAATIQQLKS